MKLLGNNVKLNAYYQVHACIGKVAYFLSRKLNNYFYNSCNKSFVYSTLKQYFLLDKNIELFYFHTLRNYGNIDFAKGVCSMSYYLLNNLFLFFYVV